jgi:hypothetical protein
MASFGVYRVVVDGLFGSRCLASFSSQAEAEKSAARRANGVFNTEGTVAYVVCHLGSDVLARFDVPDPQPDDRGI